MADDFKYHIHHHASRVVPAELAQARAARARGELDDEELEAAVGTAVADTLLEQRRLALAALSDGEFRRRNDLAPAYDAVEGFGEPGATTAVSELVGAAHAAEVRPLVGTPAARGRLVQAEGEHLGAITHRSTMIALPSPAYLAALGGAGQESGAATALAEIIRTEIVALAAAGVDYVLLRNPAYAFLLGTQGRAAAQRLGLDPDKTIPAMLEAEAAAVADLDAPEHFRVGLDLTTAGQARGAWDRDATREFLHSQPFGRLCVDHPAAAALAFPLDLVPAGLVMSLGVVDIADPRLDDVDALVARIDEAAEVMDIDDIAISTNGGFHVVGPAAAEYEHDKLQQVEMVARYFWGNEL